MRFESRYKSQALPDDPALLSCLAYVDLNLIRANIAHTPETSDHTSVKERIQPSFYLGKAVREQIHNGYLQSFDIPLKPLLPLDRNECGSNQIGLPLDLQDYLELADSTGRIVRENKRGAIDDRLTPILDRLGVDADEWLENATQFEALYYRRLAIKRRQDAAGFG